jgi:hypothetical protein
MFLKYAAIAAIVFALLAVGFNKWKKKSRHTYLLKTGGNPAPKTGRGRHEAGYFLGKMEDRQPTAPIPKPGLTPTNTDKVANASRSGTKSKRK